MTEVGPIEIGEIKTLTFDFTAEAKSGAVLSAPSVVVEVLSGTDLTPSNVKLGVATVDGLNVLQKVQPGVVGCVYKLRALVSDAAGNRHGISVKLQVAPG